MGVSFPGKKHYRGVRFNGISVTRGWVGVKFPGKKCYVRLEWPLRYRECNLNQVVRTRSWGGGVNRPSFPCIQPHANAP